MLHMTVMFIEFLENEDSPLKKDIELMMAEARSFEASCVEEIKPECITVVPNLQREIEYVAVELDMEDKLIKKAFKLAKRAGACNIRTNWRNY